MARDTSLLLIGLALGGLTLMVGLGLFVAMRRWWRSRRYGPPVDYGLMLVEYGRKMTAAIDVPALATLMTVDVPQVLRTGRAVLLLPEAHQLVEV